MEQVVAKFQCESVAEHVNSKWAKLYAVQGGSKENNSFTKFTPAGSVDIMIDKDAPAADFFVPGGEYYLTFSKSE